MSTARGGRRSIPHPGGKCGDTFGSIRCRVLRDRQGPKVGQPGMPAREWWLPSCSPGDRAFLSPSPADQGVVRTRLGRQASADLTPASRRQDYTTSPSAKAPFVCAPGDRSRKSALRSPHARGRCRVHRIPLRVRDDRETHLVGRKTARVLELIWVKRKQEYFRARTH